MKAVNFRLKQIKQTMKRNAPTPTIAQNSVPFSLKTLSQIDIMVNPLLISPITWYLNSTLL